VITPHGWNLRPCFYAGKAKIIIKIKIIKGERANKNGKSANPRRIII